MSVKNKDDALIKNYGFLLLVLTGICIHSLFYADLVKLIGPCYKIIALISILILAYCADKAYKKK